MSVTLNHKHMGIRGGMADIVGSNYNITDLHRLGGFVGDKALNGFFTGSQFGCWVEIENVSTLKQQ